MGCPLGFEWLIILKERKTRRVLTKLSCLGTFSTAWNVRLECVAKDNQSMFKFLRFLFGVLRLLFDVLKTLNFFHKDVNTHESPREQDRVCNKTEGCLSPLQHSDWNIRNNFTSVNS